MIIHIQIIIRTLCFSCSIDVLTDTFFSLIETLWKDTLVLVSALPQSKKTKKQNNIKLYYVVWFALVLWYINHCWLFNAKSSLYIYMKYIWFGLVLWYIYQCRLFKGKFSLYIRGAFSKFPDFFILEFKIVVDSWKFTTLLLYILWDDWPIFMISALNQQLQQQLEYTLLKPDCHSWWISKMQSRREDT